LVTNNRLGEILLESGAIHSDQLNEALINQNTQGGLLGEFLVSRGYISSDTLARAVAQQLNLEFCTPAKERIPEEILQIITPRHAHEYHVIPVAAGLDWVRLATCTPHMVAKMDRLCRELGRKVYWAITTPEEIEKSLERYYRAQLNSVGTVLEDLDENDLSRLATATTLEITDLSSIENLANEAPIIRMVNLMIAEGVRLGASDIHIEPFEESVQLRYRIDGILYLREPPPHYLYPAIISRIKLMAGMDITEKRLPQDGRIRLRLTDRDLDLRVAVAPTLHGEVVVMRILNRQNLLLNLEDLGFSSEMLSRFEQLIRIPYGMVLVTGPTGSGKTTTLYAVLSRLNQMERKIVTIEDPVEYELKGVSQFQVNPKLNWGFAQGLRTIVRHDPDIVLVGEIRDRETAEMAIQSALTGHLVFSTLHTNDSASAYTRLIDMGIEEFLIASTVRGVLAQRLVRKICPHCLQPYSPSQQELELIKSQYGKDIPLYHGLGCEECNNIGYRGQVGLFEMILTDDTVAELVMKRAPSSLIREAGIAKGMKTLRRDGWNKVEKGTTTLTELIRVTFD
jgi:general secretion pathway protein E